MSHQRKVKLWDVGTLNTDNDFTKDGGEKVSVHMAWVGFLAPPPMSSVALDEMFNLFEESLSSPMQVEIKLPGRVILKRGDNEGHAA